MDGKINVDFGGWIQKGFDIWKDNILTLVIVTVIASFVSGFSFGILGGAMWAGLALLTLALHDKVQPKPGVGDLFKGFSFFLQALIFFVIYIAVMFVAGLLNAIPCLGQIAALVIHIAFSTLTMFTMFYLVDKQLPAIEAIKASINIVKQNFFPFLGLGIVAGAIGMAGVILCGIGIFATLPITFCILAAAYRSVEGGGLQADQLSTPPAMPDAG